MMSEGLAMHKTVFWSVTALLVVMMVTAASFWVRSYGASDQMVLRTGTPGMAVWTTDRGRLGLLFMGEQPRAPRWIMQFASNAQPQQGAPTLETYCSHHALGFGMDEQVTIQGLEQPAVAAVVPGAGAGGGGGASWAARRVVLPFWALVLAGAGTLLVWLATVGVRIHRADHGLCPKCAYDVTHASHFCPKCGKGIGRRSWSGDARPRRRRAVAG